MTVVLVKKECTAFQVILSPILVLEAITAQQHAPHNNMNGSQLNVRQGPTMSR